MAQTGPGLNGPMEAGAYYGFGMVNTDTLVLGQERAIVISNSSPDFPITINGGYADGAVFAASAKSDVDNLAAIAVGAPIAFPTTTFSNSGQIGHPDPSTFNLLDIGTYRVTWTVPIVQDAQLVLTGVSGGIVGVGALPANVPSSVVGRAGLGDQISGNAVITTNAINTTIQIRNGASAAPINVSNTVAGNIATIAIERIA